MHDLVKPLLGQILLSYVHGVLDLLKKLLNLRVSATASLFVPLQLLDQAIDLIVVRIQVVAGAEDI